MPLLLGGAGLLGLVVGSFLNVVIHRVPRGASVVRPASACPACGSPVRRRDNVPVLSWLLLRGRCRDCGAPISVRYPVVELATAALFVGASALLGLGPRAWALPVYLYIAAVGLALALIDLETRRLPNAIVLPSYVVVGVGLTLASAATQDWAALVRALVGGAALWLLYFMLVVVKPGGMGFGDVKLAGILGGALAWLGWGALAVGGFAAFLVGGLVAVALMLTGQARVGTAIPFGPWMVVGAFIGIAAGERLWSAYLDLLI